MNGKKLRKKNGMKLGIREEEEEVNENEEEAIKGRC